MPGFMETVYGPLSQDYCIYFYFLSILGFVMMSLTVLSGLVVGVTKKKGSSFFISVLMIALAYGVFYFQNRLLYSMCVRK
jgi:hypothetical protein